MSHNWSTVLAAAVVVLVAVAMVHRHNVSAVVLICGVLPLSASVAMFNLIFALLRLSTAAGDARAEYSLALTANLASVFTTFMAIALGIVGGVMMVRLIRQQGAVDV